jgi:AraC-like DNA-binding protein
MLFAALFHEVDLRVKMVKIGHNDGMRPATPIPRLGFSPPVDESADIEVLGASDWLQRVAVAHMNHPTRLDFHQLILVTDGVFSHTVDFTLLHLTAPSVLAMRPGQVQRFEPATPWQGWVVIFRPESLPSKDVNLASGGRPLALDERQSQAMQTSVAQMAQDAALAHTHPLARDLLRSTLHSVLLRLDMLQALLHPPAPQHASLARCFERFRLATEEKFKHWHQVQQYAHTLGMSEKTLGRATQAMQGLSAKAFLSQRIALEAKRLLAHTTWPMGRVADELGFDEATNFVKFFKREVGCTPTDFRQQQRSSGQAAP